MQRDVDVGVLDGFYSVEGGHQQILLEPSRYGSLASEALLALEQARVLAVEKLCEQTALASEVVVDERESDTGALGDRPRGRGCAALSAQDLGGGVKDLLPGCLTPNKALVCLGRCA